jgi:hypothetical protein
MNAIELLRFAFLECVITISYGIKKAGIIANSRLFLLGYVI